MRAEFLSNASGKMCQDAGHTHYSVVEGVRLQYRPDKTFNVEAVVTTLKIGPAIWQQFTTVTAYAPIIRGSKLAFACVSCRCHTAVGQMTGEVDLGDRL